ncbi:MAG: 3-octaprenyl-4-hydroxybenzoate carboxy-lyase, partial [Gemmataceae bacterium]
KPNWNLPEGFTRLELAMPGVVAVTAPAFQVPTGEYEPSLQRFCEELAQRNPGSLDAVPLIVLVDDAEFTARTLNNFLWVTFTRSNPASDILGIGGQQYRKHWHCSGPLVIDARIKPHHAPPLVEDPQVSARVDALSAKSGPLADLLGGSVSVRATDA